MIYAFSILSVFLLIGAVLSGAIWTALWIFATLAFLLLLGKSAVWFAGTPVAPVLLVVAVFVGILWLAREAGRWSARRQIRTILGDERPTARLAEITAMGAERPARETPPTAQSMADEILRDRRPAVVRGCPERIRP